MHRLTDTETGEPINLASAAAEIYGMRRARDKIMPSALVGEPAWDILLALCAEHPGKLTVTSLSHSSGVPASTVLRWVAAAEAKSLVERTVPPSGEATFVALTEDGCRLMEQCLKVMLRVTRG